MPCNAMVCAWQLSWLNMREPPPVQLHHHSQGLRSFYNNKGLRGNNQKGQGPQTVLCERAGPPQVSSLDTLLPIA